jgi:hypothetical protein
MDAVHHDGPFVILSPFRCTSYRNSASSSTPSTHQQYRISTATIIVKPRLMVSINRFISLTFFTWPSLNRRAPYIPLHSLIVPVLRDLFFPVKISLAPREVARFHSGRAMSEMAIFTSLRPLCPYIPFPLYLSWSGDLKDLMLLN